ncbi:MAG: hypothetical protein ABIP78_09760, partial [Pyrinomonadaceae bacterium]
GIGSATLAQGRGHGGGGRPSGAGQPSGNPGVDRGLGNATTNSNGRSDTGLGNASSNSNGRSDDGLDRARAGRNNAASLTDTELNRYRGLSRKLGITPEEMRSRYAAALAANPDLKYGQFVAANVIADNLNVRNSSITSGAILAGLANGDSIGQTLHSLGLGKDDAKSAQKESKRKIKAAKSGN